MNRLDLPNYSIFVGGFHAPLQEMLKEAHYTNYYVLVDENTQRDCLPLLKNALPDVDFKIIAIESGEANKTIETCTTIWKQLMEAGADRKSLMLNLGGGVIGDMGGFCASTFKRGMDFIQIPTTLLSQVDASIGGKLGIDFAQVKNSIGLFNDPKAVLIDPLFLKTLSTRELRSGLAEIIKHSLIASEGQWEKLQNIEEINTVDWSSYLIPSLQIKQQIVLEDPFEHNVRKALNFGHTIGHAVESQALETETPLLHGEAVAIGMIGEAYLSYMAGILPKSSLDRITQFLLKIYGQPEIDLSNTALLLNLMRKDKKNKGGVINFTFLDGIGKFEINQTSTDEEILAALEYYNEYAKE